MLCCSTNQGGSLSSYVGPPHQHPGIACGPFVSAKTPVPACFLFANSLEVGALGRLRQLLVGGRGHVSSDLDQHGLHGEVAFPVCDAGEFGKVDLWWKAGVSGVVIEE